MSISHPIIESRQNEQIKHLAKLIKSAAYRNDNNQIVIEGIHLLQSVPLANIVKIYVPLAMLQNNEVQAILTQISTDKIFPLSNQLSKQISTLSNAVEIIAIIALATKHNSLPLNEDCILLDTIQDPGNMGTIIRSCAAGGIRHILLSPGCVDVYSPKVLRSAMGAHFSVELYKNINLLEFVTQYKGNILLTTVSNSAKSIYQFDLTGKNAWIIGNEGAGVITDFTKQLNIIKVSVPMLGDTESLNVAMATTVCVFEQLRQRIIS